MPAPSDLSPTELVALVSGILDTLVNCDDWDAAVLNDVSNLLTTFNLADICHGLPSAINLTCGGALKRTDATVCPACLARADRDHEYAHRNV